MIESAWASLKDTTVMERINFAVCAVWSAVEWRLDWPQARFFSGIYAGAAIALFSVALLRRPDCYKKIASVLKQHPECRLVFSLKPNDKGNYVVLEKRDSNA